MKLEKILVVGDIHGKWNLLNDLIIKEKPNKIIQCGDFGFWPKIGNFSKIKNYNTEIYFCDGNHEDHNELKNLKNNEIKKNIFYMPRGSVLELIEGRKILFIGGSNSTDKNVRMPYIDWFLEETISYKDLDKINFNDRPDIIISHTCPNEFMEYLELSNSYDDNDCSRKALSYVLEIFKPKLWIFGHFHKFKEGIYQDTKWICLNKIENQYSKYFVEI